MSSFSIASSLALRNNYKDNRTLAVKTNRNDASTSKLNQADSLALRQAVKRLDSYDFKTASKKDLEEKVRAFVDTYNYTLESTSKSDDKSISSANKNIKNLSKKYASELENLGIRIDDAGYMKLSTSATKNIKGEKFESLLGKDSEYMKSLNTYAKRITNHVDAYA